MNFVADVTNPFPFFATEADALLTEKAAQSSFMAVPAGYDDRREDAGVRLPVLAAREWPAEAKLVMSALDAARAGSVERRAAPRRLFRVIAMLRLYADQGQAPRVLYTRDANPRGMGFISRDWMQVGVGGKVEFEAADGTAVVVSCTITRSRQAAPGWYEGSIHFTRDQHQFAD